MWFLSRGFVTFKAAENSLCITRAELSLTAVTEHPDSIHDI